MGGSVMGTDAKAVVRLSIEERVLLERMLNEPRVAKDRVLRIQMLLKSDADGPKWPDSKIAEAFDVSTDTVARLRHRCVFEGLEAAIARRPHRATKPRRLDGAAEARLVQLACSTPPAGAAKWTMQLLSGRVATCARRLVSRIADAIPSRLGRDSGNTALYNIRSIP